MKKHQCEVEGCTSQVKYALYRTNENGQKEWLHVCPACEGKIGNQNMVRYAANAAVVLQRRAKR